MDAIALLIQIGLRSGLLLMPMTVAWLAFRRLSLSETSNAWLYAGSGLFAAFAAAGLAPWAILLTPVNWPFLLFALLSPVVWVGVVVVCGIDRIRHYDVPVEAMRAPRLETLILEGPEWPGTPVPVFRHGDRRGGRPTDAGPAKAQPSQRTLIDIARDMRAEKRRADIRGLLPPPATFGAPDETMDLPFLR